MLITDLGTFLKIPKHPVCKSSALKARNTVNNWIISSSNRVQGDFWMEQKEPGRAKCTACRAGEPTVTPEEIVILHPLVESWSIVDRDGIKRLERAFRFKDFAEALSFTNRIGCIAEEEGHHPAITTEWGKVTVTWWTHKIKVCTRMTSSWLRKQM